MKPDKQTAKQIMTEARVESLMSGVNKIAVTLTILLLAWVGYSVSNLNTQVAVLIAQNESQDYVHTGFDRRITKLEKDQLITGSDQ